MARSRVMRSWHRQGAAVSALLTGLVGGVPFFIFLYARWPLVVALAWALVAGIVSGAFAWKMHHGTVRGRLHKYFRDQYGERESFPCAVELDDDGVRTAQLGTHFLFEWSNIEEVRESEDAVEIYTRSGGGVFVKKRFFSSPEEMRQFMGAAQRQLNVSRTSSNWLHGG